MPVPEDVVESLFVAELNDDGPARAICGLEISERVGDLGIRIRAGVHTANAS
jgi:hypothetical protein